MFSPPPSSKILTQLIFNSVWVSLGKTTVKLGRMKRNVLGSIPRIKDQETQSRNRNNRNHWIVRKSWALLITGQRTPTSTSMGAICWCRLPPGMKKSSVWNLIWVTCLYFCFWAYVLPPHMWTYWLFTLRAPRVFWMCGWTLLNTSMCAWSIPFRHCWRLIHPSFP